MIANGPSSPLHAMVFRKPDGTFLLVPHCVFCARPASANSIPFATGLMLGAAYVCDPCVEKRQDGPTDNLSLATGEIALGPDIPAAPKKRGKR